MKFLESGRTFTRGRNLNFLSSNFRDQNVSYGTMELRAGIDDRIDERGRDIRVVGMGLGDLQQPIYIGLAAKNNIRDISVIVDRGTKVCITKVVAN